MTLFAAFSDYETATREVLAHLHDRMGFRLWMMTRSDGADWTVLQLQNQIYPIEQGDILPGVESLCSRMIANEVPYIVPDCRQMFQGGGMPVSRLDIGAFVSVPVQRADGTLFGTLCALDPEPQPPGIVDELSTIELLVRLLGTLLEAEQLADQRARELGATVNIAMRDDLTEALNRRGWKHRLAFETERAKVFGSHSCVMLIDLDDLKSVNDRHGHAAGDELLKRTADCLRGALRSSDALARMGGDEFAVLIAECDERAARQILSGIRDALARAGIEASLGMAMARSAGQLDAAIDLADEAMYADKAARRGGSAPITDSASSDTTPPR